MDDLRCVLKSYDSCAAKILEGCQCRRMPRNVYAAALRKKLIDIASKAEKDNRSETSKS
jgi:hypothetical protein